MPQPAAPAPADPTAPSLSQPTAPSQTGTGTEAQPPPPSGDVSTWVGGGVAVAVALLFAYALARKRAARRREMAEEERRERPQLEAKERIEPLPARPEEAREPVPARRAPPVEKRPEPTPEAREAERAAEAAEKARLEAKRLVEAAKPGDAAALAAAERAREAAAKARAEAEALQAKAEEAERKRKEEEEERKKAEYRAKKAQEEADRERRRAEAEERKRQEEEAARKRAEEEAEARRQAEEAERRKIQAQAGKTLAEGLAKTRGGFMARLNAFVGRGGQIDEAILGELEEVLFSADIGVKTAGELLEFARAKVKTKDLSDPAKLKQAIRGEVERIVNVKNEAPDWSSHKPYVLMVVGVNGSGKTTTIGKLAAKLTAEGKKVLMAAGDTFRAAATEQLEVWGQRAGAPVVKGKEGSDPGAVIFDALKRAQAEGFDVVICDTAGRLHTKAPLMEELKRVKRVMEKALPGSPHDTLLVLDSTNGQNAIAQAREFNGAMSVNGIVLTKLDGTAKGGVIIGICDELKLPVRYVGIGEAVGDLKPFDPKEFVEALFD